MDYMGVDCGRALAVAAKLSQAIDCCDSIMKNCTESRNELETCWSGKAADSFRAAMNDEAEQAKKTRRSLVQAQKNIHAAVEKIQALQEAARAAAGGGTGGGRF